MGYKDRFKVRLGELLDIPVNAFSGMMTVEIRGFYEIMIHGCRGITDYSENTCILSSDKFDVVISGCGLELNVFNDDRIIIRGEIESVMKKEKGK